MLTSEEKKRLQITLDKIQKEALAGDPKFTHYKKAKTKSYDSLDRQALRYYGVGIDYRIAFGLNYNIFKRISQKISKLGKKRDKYRYIYPAVVTSKDGSYLIEFPDFPGCSKYVHHETNILAKAEETLAAQILNVKKSGEPIPNARRVENIHTEKLQRVIVVDIWLPNYIKK